jgi:hypothetical protein
MKKKLIEVVVDRRKWYRGRRGDYSRLRLRDGRMCCLGFACRAVGLKAKDITDVGIPKHLSIELQPSWATDVAIGHMVDTNDDDNLSERQREAALKRSGRQVGLRLTFVN